MRHEESAIQRALLQERFDRLTIPEPNSGCLLWLGAPTGQLGHGQLKINGRNIMASHVALELAGRPVPAGMFACHTCDNPACVEERHLFHGTQLDNVRDAVTKGRHDMSGLGAAHGYNNLPEELKLEARRLYDAGIGLTATARKIGHSPQTVWRWFIKWGHQPKRIDSRWAKQRR